MTNKAHAKNTEFVISWSFSDKSYAVQFPVRMILSDSVDSSAVDTSLVLNIEYKMIDQCESDAGRVNA